MYDYTCIAVFFLDTYLENGPSQNTLRPDVIGATMISSRLNRLRISNSRPRRNKGNKDSIGQVGQAGNALVKYPGWAKHNSTGLGFSGVVIIDGFF